MESDTCVSCGSQFVKLKVSKEFRLQQSYKGFCCGYCTAGFVLVNVYSLGGNVGDWTWKELQRGL